MIDIALFPFSEEACPGGPEDRAPRARRAQLVVQRGQHGRHLNTRRHENQ